MLGVIHLLLTRAVFATLRENIFRTTMSLFLSVFETALVVKLLRLTMLVDE